MILDSSSPTRHALTTKVVILIVSNLVLPLAGLAEEPDRERESTLGPATESGNAFRASLSGGITVELLAVSHPNTEKWQFRRENPTKRSYAARDVPSHWWAPDGNAITQQDFRRAGASAGSPHFEFVVRVEGAKDYQITARSDLTAASLAVPRSVHDRSGKVLDHTHCLHMRGLEQAARLAGVSGGRDKTAKITVSLATGPWRDMCVYGPGGLGLQSWEQLDGKGPSLYTDAGLWFSWPRQEGADIHIEALHTYTDSPVRMVATDKQDRLHIAVARRSGGGVGLQRLIFRFKDMKLEDLDLIKFQRRSYDKHAEFPGVVIVPDHRREFFRWTEFKSLIGKPAPELQKIKGWKNGGPVKLADLRNKVVLLDFWNWRCGGCLYDMPQLMELHDTYKDKGLVIVSVHADMADSIEDMDRRLARAREKFWGGRDLPFLVALDGGGETPIPGLGITIPGATTAAYRVSGFPTTVLIDRQGMLVGELTLRKPEEARRRIEECLGKK